MLFDDVPNKAGTEEAVVAYYIEILTERGDLVVDPFSREKTVVIMYLTKQISV